MRKVPSIADYFIVASGTSTTHVRAVTDNLVKKVHEAGGRLWHSEGEREASWILLDFGDIVVHVFLEATRAFYDLERLWADVPQKRFKEASRVVKSKKAGKKTGTIKKRKKK